MLTPLMPVTIPHLPTASVQPFTYKDGMSFYEKLAWLARYINREVIPYVNSSYEELAENTEESVNALIVQVNAAIEYFMTNSVELQDEVMETIVNDVESATREAIEAIFGNEFVRKTFDREYLTIQPAGGDDTAGLQAFINDVKAGIRDGYIRDNTYRVSNLVLDYTDDENIALGFPTPQIRGGSVRGTIIQQIPGSIGPVLEVIGKGDDISHAGKVTGLDMGNFTIIGAPGGGDGIKFRSFTGVKLSDFWIQSCGGNGISLDRQAFAFEVEDDYAYGMEISNGKILLNDGYGIASVGIKPIGPILLSSLQIEHNDLGGILANPVSFTVLECYIGGNNGPGVKVLFASDSNDAFGFRMIGGRLEGNTGYEADVQSSVGAMFLNVVNVATDGATNYRIGDGGAKSANGAQIIGGFISGNKSAGQKAIVIGSNARGVQILSPEFDVAQYGTPGDYVDSIMQIITNGGQETVIRHRGYSRTSNNVMVEAANADQAFQAWQKNDTIRRFGVRGDGLVSWGPGGSTAPDTQLSRAAADRLAMGTGDSFSVDGTWNGGTFVLGSYRLWVDSTGKLRIFNGVPGSDTAGTIVGTQA